MTATSRDFLSGIFANVDASWRPATRPIGFLWLSLASGAALNAIAQLILVRHLDPMSYGALAAAFSAAAIIAPLASLGLGGHTLQRFGEEGPAARRWLFPSAQSLLISCSVAVAALTAWSFIAHSDTHIRRLTFLLIPWCVMQASSGFLYALYQVEARYPQLAAWQIAPNASRLAAAAVALWANKSGEFVAGATSLAAAGIILGQSAVFRKLAPSADGAERPSLRSVLAGSWPFAASGSLFLIYYQSDIFLLAWLRGPLESAPYAAASLPLTLLYHFPAAVYLQYLAPKLNRWAWHDPIRMRRVQGLALGIVTAVGVLCAAIIFALAPWGAARLFGPAYTEAGVYLRWLALGIPLRYLSIGLGAGLVSPRQVKLRAAGQGVTAAANVAMNLLFIPRYGAYAAIVSTIISEGILITAYSWARQATR